MVRYVTDKLICNFGKADFDVRGIVLHNGRIVFALKDEFMSINLDKSVFVPNVVNGRQFVIGNAIFKMKFTTGKVFREDGVFHEMKALSSVIVDVLNGQNNGPMELYVTVLEGGTFDGKTIPPAV